MANESIREDLLEFYIDVLEPGSSGSEAFALFDVDENYTGAWTANMIPHSDFDTGSLIGSGQSPYNAMGNKTGTAGSPASEQINVEQSNSSPYLFFSSQTKAEKYPAGTTVRLDDELQIVTAQVGSLCQVTRGAWGTTQTIHGVGTTVHEYGGDGFIQYSTAQSYSGNKSLLMKAGGNANANTLIHRHSDAQLMLAGAGDVFEVEAKFYVPAQNASDDTDTTQPNYPGYDATYPIRLFVFGADSGDYIFSNSTPSYTQDILQRAVQYTASMETGDFYDFTYPGPPNLRNSHSASVASTYGIAVSKNSIPRNQWFTIRARVRFGDYGEKIDSVTTRIDVGGHYQLFYVDDWKLSRPDGVRLSVFMSGSTNLSLGNGVQGQPAW